jgi:hypothetical protein
LTRRGVITPRPRDRLGGFVFGLAPAIDDFLGQFLNGYASKPKTDS